MKGVKRSPEHIAAMIAGNAHRRKPPLIEHLCECGCGGITTAPRYIAGHNHRGKRHTKEWIEKQSKGVKNAHNRGIYVEVGLKRRVKTIESRPLCKCGCGKPISRAGALYAKGCFDSTTPENQKKAIACRDWDRLSPLFSKRMKERIDQWKESGELDVMRQKSKQASGMPDHISAKLWVLRDPCGAIHHCSNLTEWARKNTFRFEDDRPHSKAPFWRRISMGIGSLLGMNGKSCSYKGWVAVSKRELENGAPDMLSRIVVKDDFKI